MTDFPGSTRIHRRLPKEAFYRRLPLTAAQKENFVSDVDRIFVENSLTRETLNLPAESEIREILILSILLKKREFHAAILEAIARQNPHKLLFLLSHEDRCQLALYHGKLYRSPWMTAEEVNLRAEGFSLDEIWEHLIEQVALCGEQAENTADLTINARLALQERIVKLEELLAKTEAAAWKEQQPKKRFALYQKAQAYKRELEELKNGQF